MEQEIVKLRAEIAQRKAALVPRSSPRLDTPIGQVHVPLTSRSRLSADGRTAYGYRTTVNGRTRPVRLTVKSYTTRTTIAPAKPAGYVQTSAYNG